MGTKTTFGMMVCAVLLSGCSSLDEGVSAADRGRPSAGFEEMAMPYRSDAAIIRNQYETVLWRGSPYANQDGEWEWEITPPPTPEEPAPEPIKVRTVQRVIHFAFDSSKLNVSAKAVLEKELAQPLSIDAVIIDAHTDAKGADRYNDRLSLRRADSVKSFLVAKGIPASKISTQALGEKSPVASNATKPGRAKNRRAELRIVVTGDTNG